MYHTVEYGSKSKIIHYDNHYDKDKVVSALKVNPKTVYEVYKKTIIQIITRTKDRSR